MNQDIHEPGLSCRTVIKRAVLLAMLSISCFDFDFESEYEDINGIYLEFVRDYPYGGRKLLFQGDTGYIVNYDSLLAYDFSSTDSIFLSDFYTFGYEIVDFLIQDDYAYLLRPVGLCIVDMKNTPPLIIGTLDLQYPEIIKKSDNYLYVVDTDEFVIIDATEKTNPALMSTYELDNSISALEIDSNFAYLLSTSDVHILNIEEPQAPVLHFSILTPDTSLHFLAFTKKGSYVYVSAQYTDSLNSVLITYDLSANHTMNTVSQMTFPTRVQYMGSEDEFALALSQSTLYLLNLEYPSSPCIGEMMINGGTYGTTRNNYICNLNPWSLDIIEIRQVQ